ncbi:MAG: NAD-dependent epimerase/dehydratase family protein [Serpentinimonas sp.]|nr:NAD-dependent epimerase/dehydratase family protein [Serpentinimonas sp.]
MKVLVTGANGFVGRALCAHLEQSGCTVVRAVRSTDSPFEFPVGAVHGATPWGPALGSGVEAVVHLAAQAALADQSPIAMAMLRELNVEGTANLARQCAAHGVRRLVFVSTAKVLGEGRVQPYTADDPPQPAEPYARSKWEAEQALQRIAAETGLEVVILRPPLVYGPGVKANFLSLMAAVDRRWPLPLGAIRNRRSLLYLGNLVDAITCCLAHPAAAGHTYLLSDSECVSTPELVRRLAAALGRSPVLLPLPAAWMRGAGKLLGKQAAVERLLGSLVVDSGPIRQQLAWLPPYSLDAGLAATAAWYRGQHTLASEGP